MKKLIQWLADEAIFLCVLGAIGTVTFILAGAAYESGVKARKAKQMQTQIAVESVRRGYAELVVNTNTGDFEVRLKEVAP